MGLFGGITDIYDDMIRTYSYMFDVDFNQIKAVIGRESSFKANAFRQEANDASYGLMQTLYGTAKAMGYTGPASGLFDPETSIQYGTKYLKYLIDRDHLVNADEIYAAYNSGKARRNAEGIFINSKGNTNVQDNVDGFLKYYDYFTGSSDVNPPKPHPA